MIEQLPRRGWPYQQIASLIRTRITDGTYSPGQQLPTLDVLQEETGCAVKTIRKGIAVLAREGLVVTVPGRGNYVR